MRDKQIVKATIPTYGAFVDYYDGNSPLNSSGVIRHSHSTISGIHRYLHELLGEHSAHDWSLKMHTSTKVAK